jgi:hypothetical protein
MARPRGNRKSARLTISLDEEAHATLCAMARSEDVSVAWIVRRAVNELIAAYTASIAQPELPLSQRSAHSRILARRPAAIRGARAQP